MNVLASNEESQELQNLTERLKQNAVATISDSFGNVVEVLDVEVNVQKRVNTRAIGSIEHVVTYTVRSTNNHSSNGSKDGVTATATITSRDVLGTNNILISVSGGWSGDGVRDAENATTSRTVKYASTSFSGTQINSGSADNVGTSFFYAPSDFTGYTFTLSASAKITATGNTLSLFATTDS